MPYLNDTDADGLSDRFESELGTNPLASDTGNDGMPDEWEYLYNFNPLEPDSSFDNDEGWLVKSL